MNRIFVILLIIVLSFSTVFSAGIKGIVKNYDGGLEEAVIYIEKIEGKTFTPPTKPASLDQIDLTFVPHILPILVGTNVAFPNSDATRHNVFSPSKAKKIDLGTYSPGTSKTVLFDKPGVYPILCHVHPEMSSFIIVTETPYFAVSNLSGNYYISDVPPGKYKLTVWHETEKSISQMIEVVAGKDKIVNFILDD